jgi:hypothetical protein
MNSREKGLSPWVLAPILAYFPVLADSGSIADSSFDSVLIPY